MSARSVENLYLSSLNYFSDEEMTDVNVFGSFLEDRIFCQRNCSLIVHEDGDWVFSLLSSAFEESLQPKSFFDCLSGFCT
jgi:hypothetical protein